MMTFGTDAAEGEDAGAHDLPIDQPATRRPFWFPSGGRPPL
jgi:hypothetical protein